MDTLHHGRFPRDCRGHFAGFVGALAVLCAGTLHLAAEETTDEPLVEIPPGLPELDHPEANPLTPEKIALGQQLYFDPRLSTDNSVSCATCHDPQHGWSNNAPVATGIGDQTGNRSSPTIINSAYVRMHFWDGRAGSLEEQALGPIHNPIEMGMKSGEVTEKINAVEGYRKQFQEVFGTDVTDEGIAKAIAAFERTILSGDAPWDRYQAGDEDALSDAAERGRKLFFGKANCSACHAGPNFTDQAFHNIGIGMDQDEPDEGRAAISGLEGDTGAFKTPTLREIKRTAPYMHDGSLKTLEEVVEHYDKGGIDNPYLDEELFALNLSEQQKADLVTFLKEGLSSESYPMVEAPELPGWPEEETEK